jgi:hypothetical protein
MYRSFTARVGLVVCLLALAAPLQAGPLSNGGFANGLNGWTVSDAVYVTVNGSGQAVISESLTDAEVTLYQDFTLPTNVLTLKFQLLGVTTEAETFGALPDAFNAALLNPGDPTNSLVGTVSTTTDAYYTRDLVDGVAAGLTGPEVLPGALNPGFPLTISLNVASLAGQDVRLLFRLIGGSEPIFDSSVTIDNIEIITSGNGGGGGGGGDPTAIPEPASVLLILVGSAGLFAYRRRMRGRLAG